MSDNPRPKPAMSSSANLVKNIEKADGWDEIVACLCTVFAIPDLTTRSGLKKAYNNFETLNKRLDTSYKKNVGNEKIMGGIVGIYAKMCVDFLLRDKIFQQDILSKLVPLLDMPSCRILALRSLSTMTHHGGIEARTDIARIIPRLLNLMQTHQTDPEINELCIVTMAHSLSAVLLVPPLERPDPLLLKSLDIPLILRLATEVARKPWATPYTISHSLELLLSPALHSPQSCKDFPLVIDLFAGCFHSSSVAIRTEGLMALFHLHLSDGQQDFGSPDERKLADIVERGFPAHLKDIALVYGFERCETVAIQRAISENLRAFTQVGRDRDLCALGITLAGLIVKTERAVHFIRSSDSLLGFFSPRNIPGLPFTMSPDALPHCEDALRGQRGLIENAEDLADILKLKYFIISRQLEDALEMAKQSINRNPGVPYFYYVAALCSTDPTEGLRYAKQGTKCRDISIFVKTALLQRAVEHAGHLALQSLSVDHGLAESTGTADLTMAFLQSALEDSKVFIDEAPPDARQMYNMLCWNISLTLATKGPQIDDKMDEIQVKLDKLKLADEFNACVGIPPAKTQVRLVQQSVVKHYPAGIKEWSGFIDRLDQINASDGNFFSPESTNNSPKSGDDLAAWLDKMDTDPYEECDRWATPQPKVDHFDGVALYRCAWCGNPSAVLKKCSRCATTRYCDQNCQKLHYKTHKIVCKPKATNRK